MPAEVPLGRRLARGRTEWSRPGSPARLPRSRPHHLVGHQSRWNLSTGPRRLRLSLVPVAHPPSHLWQLPSDRPCWLGIDPTIRHVSQGGCLAVEGVWQSARGAPLATAPRLVRLPRFGCLALLRSLKRPAKFPVHEKPRVCHGLWVCLEFNHFVANE